MLERIHGTWLGGAAVHSYMIPSWTLSPVPLIVGLVLIFQGGTAALIGVGFISLLVWLNVHTFAYRPEVVRLAYDLDMSKYYRKCELRGALDKVKTSNTLFMFHPHGILAVGFVVNGVWSRHFNTLSSEKDLEPGQHTGTMFLIARNLREWSAFFKVLCDVSGRLSSATKENINSMMAAKRNIGIIPGGFEDATLHKFGCDRTCIMPRKGLIKYALQYGYAVTPIWTFGESDTYYTFTAFLKQRLALNQYSIPGVAFFGDLLMPLFPRHQSCCLTYVGEPLQMPHLPHPTQEEVDEWHGKYVAALRELYSKHKSEANADGAGSPSAQLEIY